MAYTKILVDNPICSRRFHLTYDDQGPKTKVKLQCPFCTTTIFASDSHPAVTLARQENLIKDAEMSDNIVNECTFVDTFSEKTIRKPDVSHG
jgi:hypothetical protein